MEYYIFKLKKVKKILFLLPFQIKHYGLILNLRLNFLPLLIDTRPYSNYWLIQSIFNIPHGNMKLNKQYIWLSHKIIVFS